MWEQVVARVGKVRATSVFSNWKVLIPDIHLNVFLLLEPFFKLCDTKLRDYWLSKSIRWLTSSNVLPLFDPMQ